MKKCGTVLINEKEKQIALVYRKKKDDYSFPKGHLEEGESLIEGALRETEEETGRLCHLVSEKVIGIMSYVTNEGHVDTYMYLAVDDGKSEKEFKEDEKEELVWVDIEKVEETLSYDNLKDFWKEAKKEVDKYLNK